jgi:hypothetical protein
MRLAPRDGPRGRRRYSAARGGSRGLVRCQTSPQKAQNQRGETHNQRASWSAAGPNPRPHPMRRTTFKPRVIIGGPKVGATGFWALASGRAARPPPNGCSRQRCSCQRCSRQRCSCQRCSRQHRPCSRQRRPALASAGLLSPVPTCSHQRRPALTSARLLLPAPACSHQHRPCSLQRRPAFSSARLLLPAPACSHQRRPALANAGLTLPLGRPGPSPMGMLRRNTGQDSDDKSPTKSPTFGTDARFES